jgi:hypothetical protein
VPSPKFVTYAKRPSRVTAQQTSLRVSATDRLIGASAPRSVSA